jgi:hypothetical protein
MGPNDETLLYTYRFFEIDMPIVIEASNQIEARRILNLLLFQYPEYANSRVISQTVESPVTGVTTKVHHDIKYIWVGKQKTLDGWMPIQNYRP